LNYIAAGFLILSLDFTGANIWFGSKSGSI